MGDLGPVTEYPTHMVWKLEALTTDEQRLTDHTSQHIRELASKSK